MNLVPLRSFISFYTNQNFNENIHGSWVIGLIVKKNIYIGLHKQINIKWIFFGVLSHHADLVHILWFKELLNKLKLLLLGWATDRSIISFDLIKFDSPTPSFAYTPAYTMPCGRMFETPSPDGNTKRGQSHHAEKACNPLRNVSVCQELWVVCLG